MAAELSLPVRETISSLVEILSVIDALAGVTILSVRVDVAIGVARWDLGGHAPSQNFQNI